MNTTRNKLDGRVALVTGASRGVGKGIALELARAGCRVAVNYQSSPALAEATVAEIRTMGGEAFSIKGDVGNASDVREMISGVVSRFRGLDLLVNNAGVQTWKPFLEVSETEWDQVINTNLKGCFLCSQTAALYMKDHGGGTIVNIGSGCNKLPFPNLVAYTASKGGIEMLTKVAAVELGRYGIRVNCIAPGLVRTDFARALWENPAYLAGHNARAPLGRIGEPDDIAGAAVFLASKASAFMTGQTIVVDGGVTIA